MGYGIKFFSRTQLRDIIEQNKETNPVASKMAEAVLSAYEVHLSLEQLLIETLSDGK